MNTPERERPSRSGKPRVLVVEDNRGLNSLLCRQLARDYVVASARDGQEGLEQARAAAPDLIVTDSMMPRVDGQELVRQVRADPSLARIPIIVVSAVVDEEMRIGLFRAGAQEIMSKPFSLEELGVRVANLISKKRADEQLMRVVGEQNLLAEMGMALASLELQEVRQRVADLTASALGDLCLLETVELNGGVRCAVTCATERRASGAGEALAAFKSLLRKCPRIWADSDSFEKQQPVVLNHVAADDLSSICQSQEVARLLQALNPTALLKLPLEAHGRPVGTMMLLRTTPERPFRVADVALGEEIARRAALSLENARLYVAAQRAVEQREEVLSMVAHDLRNPLNAMLLQLQLMRRRKGEPERRSQAPLETLLREGTKLDRMIGDLLDVVRFEAGQLTLECQPLAAADLLNQALASNVALAEKASLLLSVAVERELGHLLADERRLLQVLDNLVGNALKFTPAGGSITLGAEPHENAVVFWVADTGSGITTDQLPHLFVRFWQAERRNHRGCGLGLSIVKSIVEAHQGHVWVDTEAGRGSTFYVSLPRTPLV